MCIRDSATTLRAASPVFVVECLAAPAEMFFALRTHKMVTAHILLNRIAALRVRAWLDKVHDVRVGIRFTLDLLDPRCRVFTCSWSVLLVFAL